MYIDLDALSASHRYHMLIQTLVPRPVAWVLTQNQNHSFNVAPFSYFSGVSSHPPLLMFVAGKKNSGAVKDTRANIIETKQFVVHIPHVDLAQHVTDSAAPFATNVSEVDALELETTEFGGFELPRLSCCRVAYACECFKIEAITDDQAMIFGLIKAMYIDDQILTERNGRQQVDIAKLNPLARLGGDDYASVAEPFTIKRKLSL